MYSDPITTPGHVVKNMFDYLEEQEEYIESALRPNKPMKLTPDDWKIITMPLTAMAATVRLSF